MAPIFVGCDSNRGPVYVMCGGVSNFTCSNDFYCQLGDNCGGIDREGTCKFRPLSCLTEESTVCGCDSKNYKNECVANAIGMSVKHKGQCIVDVKQQEKTAETKIVCGGVEKLSCPSTMYCEIGIECGGSHGKGICKGKPEICTAEVNEVCGCDNQTYSNMCNANMVGITVKHSGKCNNE